MKAKTAAMMFRVLGIGISAGLVAMDANAVEVTGSIGNAVGIDVYKVQCTAATSKRIRANVTDVDLQQFPLFHVTVFVNGDRAVRRMSGEYLVPGEWATVFRPAGTGPFTGHVLITDVKNLGNVDYKTNINCQALAGANQPTVITRTQNQ